MSGVRLTGPHGTAVQLDIRPEWPRTQATVDHWLITAPPFHPWWSQYTLCCVRLDDMPGMPPATKQFVGATHELLVVALNPKQGPYDAAAMYRYAEAGGGLPYLVPVNIAHQFIATDDEMRQVCALGCSAVVNGRLNPETADAPAAIRLQWLGAVTKTLAHIRGEEHAP